MRALTDVLREHTPRLLQIPGVVGTGEGRREGRPVLLVLVSSVEPELSARLPKEIEGYPVETRQVGDVRGLS
jgi:hypothetical protein